MADQPQNTSDIPATTDDAVDAARVLREAQALEPSGDDQAVEALAGAQQAVDALLREVQKGGPAVESPSPAAGEPAPATGEPSPPTGAEASPPANVSQVSLETFQQVIRDAQVTSIDLLRDVDLNVKIELGRSRMLVEDVLKLTEGSVVELDKLAGDPVDVLVNDQLVARGEVLVLNDNFCVRINEIVAGGQEEGA